MLTFVTVVHVLLCVFMIFVILLQPGKDAGMGSALGGGAATSAFGGRGAVTFLSKLTGICASLFFVTSLGLSFVGMRTSVVSAGESPAAQEKPVDTKGQPQNAAPVVPPGTPAAPSEPAAPAAPGGAAPAAPGSVPAQPGTTPTPQP